MTMKQEKMLKRCLWICEWVMMIMMTDPVRMHIDRLSTVLDQSIHCLKKNLHDIHEMHSMIPYCIIKYDNENSSIVAVVDAMFLYESHVEKNMPRVGDEKE
jgi:hypothetical protein